VITASYATKFAWSLPVFREYLERKGRLPGGFCPFMGSYESGLSLPTSSNGAIKNATS